MEKILKYAFKYLRIFLAVSMVVLFIKSLQGESVHASTVIAMLVSMLAIGRLSTKS